MQYLLYEFSVTLNDIKSLSWCRNLSTLQIKILRLSVINRSLRSAYTCRLASKLSACYSCRVSNLTLCLIVWVVVVDESQDTEVVENIVLSIRDRALVGIVISIPLLYITPDAVYASTYIIVSIFATSTSLRNSCKVGFCKHNCYTSRILCEVLLCTCTS